MDVIVIDNASLSIRGELTRWMLEVKPGVFVGNTSAMVRERLWEKVSEEGTAKGALLLYSSDSEQGFRIKLYGDPKRRVIDLDGVQLIETR